MKRFAGASVCLSNAVFAVIVALSCFFCTSAQAQTNIKMLMNDTEYKAYLHQVEIALPKWETSLKNIDIEKDQKISYSMGKMIVTQRDLGLMQVGYIRDRIARETVKHTVYGELALLGFLEGLTNEFNEIAWINRCMEIANNPPLHHFEDFAPELSSLVIRLGNDANERVKLLEQNVCH